MKNKNRVLLIGLFLAIGISSEATLLAYEGFDYPAGSLNGQNTGDGWSTAWNSSSNYDVATNSLTMPNLPFASIGGSAIGQNTANRDFPGIDFSQEGVYYVSYIMKRTGWGAADGGGEYFDFHFRTTGNADTMQAGIGSTEVFAAKIAGGSTGSGGDASSTEPYFIVLKIVTHATAADEIYLKAYSSSNTIDTSEAIDWTVTGGTAEQDVLANRVTLWAGNDNDGDGLFQAAIDEIRVGTTWDDVVPNQNSSDLIAYEGFDYSAGSLNALGGSVDGWLGAWNSGSNYDVVTNSLTMPNLPFATTGGSIIGQSTANRYFTGIDLSQDAVYYASFIMQRTGWGAADNGGEYFDFYFRTTGFAKAAQAGIGSSEAFQAKIEGGNSNSAGDAATTNPYFIVTKIVAHATGADEIYLQAYSISDTIALEEVPTWMLTGGTGTNSLLANMVTLWAGADDDGDGLYQAAIDEIRIGKTWASVVPSEILLPATIVSLKTFDSNTLEMVVSAPSPSRSYPKRINDLTFGSWTNVEHSIDGNVPFVETNLTYSTPSGPNKVIYVKADEAAKFFKIDTGE